MNTSKLILITVLFILYLAPQSYGQQPEELIGIALNYEENQLSLQVVASGCTEKEHFKFQMKNDTLSIFRTRIDACKAMQEVITLTFSFREAGIQPNKPFAIRNRFIGNLYLANMARQ